MQIRSKTGLFISKTYIQGNENNEIEPYPTGI